MNKTRYALWIAFGLILLIACNRDDEAICNPSAPVLYDDTRYDLVYERLFPPLTPHDNPLTVQGVQLGRMLFYEKRLSKDGSQSCASCHQQEHAFADSARFSVGIHGKTGSRNSMAVFNVGWHLSGFFWDGRATTLREQSLMPIQDSLEMDESLENVVIKLNLDQRYTDQFLRTFGPGGISPERISLALEQFMSSIVSTSSKYDRYLKGQVNFSASEERGRQLFETEYNPIAGKFGPDCAKHCHTGPNFEDGRFTNNGLDSDAEMTDLGLQAVTGDFNDRGKFKVPTLRNVEKTGPYMHDGRFETLEEVVEHYNSHIQHSVTLDPFLVRVRQEGFNLSEQEKADLVAFLKTLTDESLLTNEAYSDPFK